MIKTVVGDFVALFVAMAAPAGARMVGAPAEAGRGFTWDRIIAEARNIQQQPRERSNEALKHYRDLAERGLLPNGMTAPLQPDSVPIRKCTHGLGEQFWFEEGAEMVQWSWRQMLAGLGDRGKNVVGPGFAASPCTSGRAPTITTVPTR